MPDEGHPAEQAHAARVLENERASGAVADVTAAIQQIDAKLAKPTEKPVGTPTACFLLLVLFWFVGPALGATFGDSFAVGVLAVIVYLVAVHDTWNRIRRKRRKKRPQLEEQWQQLLSRLGCGDPSCTRDPCREAFAVVSRKEPSEKAAGRPDQRGD